MIIEKPIRIVASGKYLPQKISSAEIEKKYDIEKGWIEKFSGVLNRHQVTFETNGFMGARAIESALEKAEMTLNQIDMIIAAGATFDYPLPSQSSVIKSELKDGLTTNIATIDVDTTCLSFVTGFEIASKLLDGQQYKNIIVVSSEIASKGLNTKKPETLTLFGDAAVAFILTYDTQNTSTFIKGGIKTYSEGLNNTIIKGGGNKYFFRDYPYNEDLHSFAMDGIKLLKMAKTEIPSFIKWFFDNTNISLFDITHIFPHQASKAGLTIFKNMYPLKPNQMKENISEYGNCIAASIPLLLHDEIEKGDIKRGDLCFLLGTSAGFSIGGALFRY
jgi:3-oxoacyl-[acyl-carrier-protein] synthase-3